MSGRNGLTWVTALTIASLLIGSGALNALAEGHGGGDHGNASGRGNAGHQQQTPAVVNQGKGESSNHAAPAAVQASNTEKNNNGNDSRNGAENKRDDNNNNVERKPDDDNEDMVTPPAVVTDDVRPGLGCGDKNHEHERHDECKSPGGNDDNDGAVDDGADATVTAVVDDSAGD